MNEIDEKIREALQDTYESEELFAQPSLFAEAAAPFKGKRKWVNVMGLTYGLIGFGLFLWGMIEFFHADVLKDQLAWGGLAFIGLLMNAFLKVFFWLEMHTNRTLREIKRVELLILKAREG